MIVWAMVMCAVLSTNILSQSNDEEVCKIEKKESEKQSQIKKEGAESTLLSLDIGEARDVS